MWFTFQKVNIFDCCLGDHFPQVSCFCTSFKQYKYLASKIRLSSVLDYLFKDICVVNSVSVLSKGQEILLYIWKDWVLLAQSSSVIKPTVYVCITRPSTHYPVGIATQGTCKKVLIV